MLYFHLAITSNATTIMEWASSQPRSPHNLFHLDNYMSNSPSHTRSTSSTVGCGQAKPSALIDYEELAVDMQGQVRLLVEFVGRAFTVEQNSGALHGTQPPPPPVTFSDDDGHRWSALHPSSLAPTLSPTFGG
uniref:Uncharacterized protein n=1 Tax=Leersia perrieri TaxID=77586 RepID=A0A0D9XNY1_9ORYZ